MSNFSLPLTRLVHENLSIIIDFCFSRGAVDNVMASFEGEWKYLRKTVYEISESRAKKAALELALFLRMLDDREGISDYLNQTQSSVRYGRLILDGGAPEQHLSMRDIANKIIHASRLEWGFSNPKEPILICHAHDRERERWVRAEIDVVAVAALCGNLMH